MAAFNKELFVKSAGYVTYEGKFVARFKHKPGAASSFITFLCKHFSVEEYFGAYDQGIAPLTIAEAKGYILPHVKKVLKEQGYPVTKQGKDQYIADQVAKTRARLTAA